MVEKIMELLKLKNYVKANEMVKEAAKSCKDDEVKSALLIIKMCLMKGWYKQLNTIVKKYYM